MHAKLQRRYRRQINGNLSTPFSWIRTQYPNIKMLVLPKLICRLTQFSSKSKDIFVQLKNHSKLYPKKQNSQES